MRYNPEKHHRRSIRLPGFDYTQDGSYFITICTIDHICIFGNILNGKMVLNDFGKIVKTEWLKTAEMRNNIEIDEFVVMPNHVHGILNIVSRRGTMHRAPTGTHRAPTTPKFESFGKPVPGSIPTIVRGFKSTVTKQINEIQNAPGTPVWQRNYYEHVIRNETALNRIRNYIIRNPSKWQMDKKNPNNLIGNKS